jgi:hypothetical protein
MDVKEKIIDAFLKHLNAEYIRLEDEDGISGFVVSSRFKGLSSLDRQTLIDKLLKELRLSPKEHRQVLMIAALTPAEYETVGARIPVHRIRQNGHEKTEVLLQGGQSDADFVRETLARKEIATTKPRRVADERGTLMSFHAVATKKRILGILKANAYITVMPNA